VATAQLVADHIGRIGGVPASTIRTIARRLGEAGLLPRGGRGQPPQDLSARDCARLIIGIMRIADGIDGAAARVDQLVHEVERLRSQGKVSIAETDTAEALEAAVAVVKPGSFVEQVASLIKLLSADERTWLKEAVAAIGLTTGPNRLWGWVELGPGGELLQEGGPQFSGAFGARRVIFGRCDFDTSGLTREVRITSQALSEIAAAWAPRR
jgi:hypothetical protein